MIFYEFFLKASKPTTGKTQPFPATTLRPGQMLNIEITDVPKAQRAQRRKHGKSKVVPANKRK